MRLPTLLAGALLLLALAPEPARSQSAPGSAAPIVGSGSFGDAPRVTPGTLYADSVRPNEVLYYAVRLEAGQAAQAQLDIAEGRTLISVEVFDPLRRNLPGSTELTTTGGELVTRTPVAEVLNVATNDAADAAGPGDWYFAVIARNAMLSSDRYEVPFTLQVNVAGEPVATPTPTATPEATAAEEPGESGDGQPSVALVGGVAGAGLLLGGFGAARVKRR